MTCAGLGFCRESLLAGGGEDGICLALKHKGEIPKSNVTADMVFQRVKLRLIDIKSSKKIELTLKLYTGISPFTGAVHACASI